MKPIFENKDDVKISSGNTSISIQPYKIGDFPSLEYRLSVYDNVYHRIEFIGLDYDPKRKILYLPNSINKKKIENNYKTKNLILEDMKLDPKTKIKFNLKCPPKDDLQIKTIDFLVCRGNYTGNMFYPKLMLSLDTGSGKTYCVLNAISQIGLKTAVILPNYTLIERWVKEIKKVTDIKEDEVYIISGQNSLKKIKSKTKDKKIILISHSTINRFGTDYGWDKVHKLFKLMKIGIKVYDEAHMQFKNIIKIDLHTNTYKTFYLTATAGRSILKENIIFNSVFSNVPSLVSYTKSREENHIDMIIIKYNSNPTYNERTLCKTIKGFSASKFMKYNMGSGRLHFERALEIVMNTILTNKTKGRVLILLGTVNMIYHIKCFLEQSYPILKGQIGIYCHDVSKKEKEDTFNNKYIMLSTYKSLGTGSDIVGLKYVVMTEPYSSKLIAKQCPGRLREHGWYFELVDSGFNDCVRQFESRKKILIKKSNKFKIVNI